MTLLIYKLFFNLFYYALYYAVSFLYLTTRMHNMEGLTPEQIAAIQQQCIFCQIATGKVAAKKVYEDEQVTGILDINPANPGHIILMTKKHYFVMPQIPEDETERLGIITKQLSHAALKAIKTEGTSIFIANGVTAGQRAQHFMLHIIPRMDKDKVGLELPQRQISEEDFKKIHEALKKGTEKILGKLEGKEKEEAEKEVEAEIIAEEETPTAKKEPVKTEKKEKKTKSKTAAKKSPSKNKGLDDIARLLGA